MRKFTITFTAFITLLFFSSCSSWQPLFNKKDLTNWDKFIGSPLKGHEELHKNASVDKVFSVVEELGEKLIHISGEVNGSLATKEAFENYHLQLVFKWGEKVYTRRNSGLLYHSFGEFGEAFGTWMANVECQLMHDNLGDTYLMLNTRCETEVVKDDEKNAFVFSPGQPKITFGKEDNGRSIKKGTDNENPLGEWNTVDLYCYNGVAVHAINGQTVMVNNNCSIYTDSGIEPLTSGKIQIQSEGGELFVKSIRIKPIKRIPNKVLK